MSVAFIPVPIPTLGSQSEWCLVALLLLQLIPTSDHYIHDVTPPPGINRKTTDPDRCFTGNPVAASNGRESV